MRLNTFEWGEPGAPALVCLHGVTAHGERYREIALERWARRFHVVAPDLRGHGRSGWEPPWDFATHVADLVETADALGLERPDWVGHSFGGRLVLELAAQHPERVRRAVLLDPAIQLLPHVAAFAADAERPDPVYDSVEAYVASREDVEGEARARAVADLMLHVETLPDGRVRRRTCQAAAVSIYGELAIEPPPPETLTMPALLVHAPAYGLVRDEQLEAYAEHAETLAVPGGHVLMWTAFEETAGAVESFLK